MSVTEKIVVLDFGGQYNQLIARRVRESGVYCEILNYAAPVEQWRDSTLRGVILTGGPEQRLRAGRAAAGRGNLLARRALCWASATAMQLINAICGGKVESAQVSEYGHTLLNTKDTALFHGVGRETVVFMNTTPTASARCRTALRRTPPRTTAPLLRSPTPRAASTAYSSTPRCATRSRARRCWRTSCSASCGCKGGYRGRRHDRPHGLRDPREGRLGRSSRACPAAWTAPSPAPSPGGALGRTS